MRNRNEQLNIRLTHDEMENLKTNAEKTGYTVSNYIRTLICGNSPKEHPDLAYYAFAENAEYVLDSLGALSINLEKVFRAAKQEVDITEYIDALNDEVFTMRKMLWDVREAMQLPEKAALPEHLNETLSYQR